MRQLTKEQKLLATERLYREIYNLPLSEEHQRMLAEAKRREEEFWARQEGQSNRASARPDGADGADRAATQQEMPCRLCGQWQNSVK